MASKRVIGRFAPSPTGPLHFGSVIAALGSYLDAKARGGDWLVRMEDLDPPREQAGADTLILKTLEALGLEWDGAVMYQGQRSEIYQESVDRLFEKELAYYCTCSRKEIARNNESAIYPGTCRGHHEPRNNSAIRTTINKELITFTDRLQGNFTYNLETDFGDFVVKRRDGLFAYHLAVAIDDAAQGITDIVRGADLLTSTPRQIYLQHVLGLPTPVYLHLPVAMDDSGAKLSKQSYADPVGTTKAVPTLVRALKYLNQDVPDNYDLENKTELLKWAISHWNADALPAVKSITV